MRLSPGPCKLMNISPVRYNMNAAIFAGFGAAMPTHRRGQMNSKRCTRAYMGLKLNRTGKKDPVRSSRKTVGHKMKERLVSLFLELSRSSICILSSCLPVARRSGLASEKLDLCNKVWTCYLCLPSISAQQTMTEPFSKAKKNWR